ncbi:MAG: hypothetical protein AABY83_05140 [Pseudomonadota bacterium]
MNSQRFVIAALMTTLALSNVLRFNTLNAEEAHSKTDANALSTVVPIMVDTPPAAALQPPVDSIMPLEMKLIPVENSGVNDTNPSWSASGNMLAIERNEQSKKEIVILKTADFKPIKKIYYQLEDNAQGLAMLIPGLEESVSYNAGLTWSSDDKHFVFMSNAGEGNYDLYLGDLNDSGVTRLTETKEKDGMPDWSPPHVQIAFVSGRTGGAQINWMNLATRVVKQLTNTDQTHLYPMWSPDGTRLTYMRGDNENHDIMVMNINAENSPIETPLTRWSYDDLRPTWSPDGQYIAFYTNYNKESDIKIWSLAVVKADGSDALEGDKLAGNIVATHVIPDIERGPAWLADGQHIVYIKDVKEDYNPIFIADIRGKKVKKIITSTKMNHDVSISKQNMIAFRAQVDQWDRVFVMKLPLDKLGEL